MKIVSTFYRILKIIIIFFLITSCSRFKRPEKEEISVFNLAEKPRISDIKLSTLGFYDIEYIPLESSTSCMFKGIYMIKTGKDFFLIHTFDRILKFRKDGSYDTTIGKSGRGPDEYIIANDVEIDKINRLVYLIDGLKKQLFIYSDSGKLQRKYNILCESGIQFRFIEGGFLCYNDNHSGNIENSYIFMDTCGRIIKSFPNTHTFSNLSKWVYMHENIFYRFNNRLYKKEIYSDTVYIFNDMSFKPCYLLVEGERLITTEARSRYDGLYLAAHYITPWNLFEFGDYIYYEYQYEYQLDKENIIYGFICSKENDFQAFINAGQGIINDLDNGPNIRPITILDDYTIISWIEAYELKLYISSVKFQDSYPKFPVKKKQLEELANNLKDTDNPVLILVKLRK